MLISLLLEVGACCSQLRMGYGRAKCVTNFLSVLDIFEIWNCEKLNVDGTDNSTFVGIMDGLKEVLDPDAVFRSRATMGKRA